MDSEEYTELVEELTTALLEEPAGGASAYWAARKAREKERKAAGFAPRLTKAQQEARRNSEIDAHFARGGPHDRGECGPVCTAFDW